MRNYVGFGDDINKVSLYNHFSHSLPIAKVAQLQLISKARSKEVAMAIKEFLLA